MRQNLDIPILLTKLFIPPALPDLDFPDISYRRFRGVGCDPHRFDGDIDGIGCEK